MGDTLRPLLVDACVAINLRAARVWGDVLNTGGWRPAMAEPALDEVLYVLDDDGDRQPIPLRAMADKGAFDVVVLRPEETATMLELVVELGEGEAACLAVARARGLAVATDDRAAMRAAARNPRVEVLTTAQLIRVWGESGDVQPAAVAEAIRLIEDRARFSPGDHDPDATWWARQRAALPG